MTGSSVFINGKHYRNIETLSISKLEHLLQLSQIQIENYEKVSKNYDAVKKVRYAQPYLAKLTEVKQTLQRVLEKKRSS